MNNDPTEGIRRELVAMINSGIYSEDEAIRRHELEQEYGVDNVWDTREVSEQFVIHSFMAPFTRATRKSDGKVGLLTFTHHPRFYFDFQER